MFRSETRAVVYPQLEHSRLAGAIAAAWGNDDVPRPPLPFDSFVRGVAEHDRGYGELDDDPIGGVAEERWLEIQRRGIATRDGDPVVDVVAAFHIRRLVGNDGSDVRMAAAREFDAIVAERLEESGVARRDAEAADVVTNLCDRIAFDLSCEIDSSGTVGGFAYTTSSDGVATIAPWPLGERELDVTVTGYEAAGYPRELRAAPRTFRIRPAQPA